MSDQDLQKRVKRLSSGDFRVEDLDRLFLGIRDRSYGRANVRDIGDFVAHRRLREQGLVRMTARDVFTSMEVWSYNMRGIKPQKRDIVRAALANSRLATDAQIWRWFRLRRKDAIRHLQAAIGKFLSNVTFDDRDFEILLRFAGSFVWRPAITADQLFKDFQYALSRNRLLKDKDAPALKMAKNYISLYAIALLHKTRVLVTDTMESELLAGVENEGGLLEVKMQIEFNDGPKPIQSPVCLYLTELRPDTFCSEELIATKDEWGRSVWTHPIEVTRDCKLVSM